LGAHKNGPRVRIWWEELEAAWEKTADFELYGCCAKGKIAAAAGIGIGYLILDGSGVFAVIEADDGAKDDEKLRAVE
jgi:hypothetical protein